MPSLDLNNLSVALAVGLGWFLLVLAIFRPGLHRLGLLARIFALGMVVCVPAASFNDYWMEALSTRLAAWAGLESGGHPGLFLHAALWILLAPVEEVLKYCIVFACTARRPLLAHAREGCLLGAVSALGFATFENYLYMQQAGFHVIYLRGWICPPSHMLFSVVWGYYLGLAWTRGYAQGGAVAEGLALAATAHGLYNFSSGLVPGLFGLLVPIGLVAALGRIFAVSFWTGRHQPWLASAPVQPPAAPSPVAPPVSQRRFAPAASEEARTAARELIEQMDDLDADLRIRAARRAATMADQQVLEKLRSLTRDPVAGVRDAARVSLVKLEEKLRASQPG
ncbi:MAG: PrsW family intramembrane metalloprotease [Candidatus Wallbacteria bacterium]|nr:PrsW family intramembrane metalloprotease [Candidatus Wallbacteria bacterium]